MEVSRDTRLRLASTSPVGSKTAWHRQKRQDLLVPTSSSICVRAVCRGFGQSVHKLEGQHNATSLISSEAVRRLLTRNVVLRSAPLGRPSRSNRQSPHPTLTLRRRKAHIRAPRMWDATCSYGSRGWGYARQFRVLPYATSRYTSSFSEPQCCTQVTTSDN